MPDGPRRGIPRTGTIRSGSIVARAGAARAGVPICPPAPGGGPGAAGSEDETPGRPDARGGDLDDQGDLGPPGLLEGGDGRPVRVPDPREQPSVSLLAHPGRGEGDEPGRDPSPP